MNPQMSRDDESQRQVQDQVAYMQRWLKQAPPPPVRETNQYDVFISYRSSDRVWATALYDALKLAGWEAFLDQYELVPGANLQTSLEEGLQSSSSGVILWSARTKDSEWCKRERNSMMTLKDGGPFRYVFAKLDEEPLPLFAKADLYVDFADSSDGPRGVNLLRLLCGMRGVPLSDEAVRLAAQVDEDSRRILNQIQGACDAGNADRLLQIGTSMDAGVLASSGPVLESARGLISMKEYEKALQVLAHADVLFPKCVGTTQLRGLALRRLQRYRESIEVLSELKAAGHQDPETMGILAAAWDGCYQESGKVLNLRRSRELYRTAFQADPRSYYTGINAAAKSLFLGELDEAARLAELVLPLVQHAADGKDFWAGCTLAEVYLLKRDTAAAAKQYQKMIDIFGARIGDLAETRRQATRICKALVLDEGETKKVLAPFELLD